MKKHIKLFLSLILAFTLIPILHINTANATNTINLGEVTVPSTDSINIDDNFEDNYGVATCLINDASYTFTAIPTDGNEISSTFCQLCQKVNGKLKCQPSNNDIKNTVSELSEVIFGIINTSGDTKTFDTTLQIDLGANGCYNCTTLNGVHITGGHISSCGSGNNDNDNTSKNTSGVSRILTPLATILGGLLLLF